MILGMPFLELYNPVIDWKARLVSIPTEHGLVDLPTFTRVSNKNIRK